MPFLSGAGERRVPGSILSPALIHSAASYFPSFSLQVTRSRITNDASDALLLITGAFVITVEYSITVPLIVTVLKSCIKMVYAAPVLMLPGPVLLKLPKAVPVSVLRLVLVLAALKSVPVLGLGVDVDDGLMIVEMRPVEDGSAAVVVSPLAVGVLSESGAPVLVGTVNAGIVKVGRLPASEHTPSNSKKEKMHEYIIEGTSS